MKKRVSLEDIGKGRVGNMSVAAQKGFATSLVAVRLVDYSISRV